MSRIPVLPALAGLLLVAAPAASFAQNAAQPAAITRGVFLGAGLTGTSLTIEGDEFDDEDFTENGGGLSLQIGYGFNQLFSLLVGVTGSVIQPEDGGDFVLGHLDLLGRFSFPGTTRRVVPYVEVGVTGLGAAEDESEDEFGEGDSEVTFTGGGLTLGGGVNFYLAPSVALGAGVRFTAGQFDTIKIDNVSVSDLNIDTNSGRLILGVTWFPGAGRR